MRNQPPIGQPPVWPALACLLLLVAALLGRSVSFPFLDWDDVPYILNNQLVSQPAQVSVADLLLTPNLGYIVPALVLFQAALYKLGGGQPWLFHLMNVVLHALVVALTFLLGRALCRRVLPAAVAAGLLAVHPLVAEPVAWATGQKELLSAALGLGGTYALVSWLRHGGALKLVTAAVLGVLAMLAKPTLLLLGPCWALFYLASPPTFRGPSRRAVTYTIGLTILAGLVLGLMNWYARRELAFDDPQIAGGSPLLALGHQVHHLVWPTGLHPLYATDRSAGWSDPHTWLGLVLLLLLGVVAWRGRRAGPVLLGLGLAVATYLPVSSVIPFNRYLADSYLYLPLAGLCLAVAGGLDRLLEGHATPLMTKLVVIASGVVLLAAGGLCGRQVSRWSSHENLWEPTARVFPRSPQPLLMLAQGLMYEGRPSNAVAAYRRAFSITYLDRALSGFSVALKEAGELGEAECVMVEDLHHGADKSRAANNLALFLVTKPDYSPAHPEAAATALRQVLDTHRRGELRWDRSWITTARRRLQTLRPTAAAGSDRWRPRSCKSLRPLRQR